MALSPESNENQQPKMPSQQEGGESADLDREVEAALGGASIDDLMEKAVSKGTPAGPSLDPSRPVRGGRPRRGGKHQQDERVQADNIKRGVVTAIREGNVFVDLGGKSQGICPLEQFDAVPPKEGETPAGVEVGQEYEFVYKGYDNREGLVLLARKGAVVHGAWETLQPGDVVEGQVTGMNKGGLELRVNNARAFMPAGQVDTRFNPDLSVFLNQRLQAVVTRVDRETHNIVLSRRDLLEAEQAKAADATWGELSVGQVREGTVRSVMPYGAFIDLGGVDGLLHVSAMSHTRVTDPAKIVKVGDKVQVMVLQVDQDKKKVSLGLKQLTKDPWEESIGEFTEGALVTGTVKRIVDFGAFVEIAPGVEGLVHISQVAGKRVNKVSDVLKEGDTVKAKVLSVDSAKHRISLSIAAAEREARGEAPAAGEGTAAAPAKPAPAKPARKTPLKGGL